MLSGWIILGRQTQRPHKHSHWLSGFMLLPIPRAVDSSISLPVCEKPRRFTCLWLCYWLCFVSCVGSFVAGTHTPRLGVLWEEGILKSGRREEAALHLFLSPGCSYVRAFCIFQTEARQKQHRARQVDVGSQFWEVALCPAGGTAEQLWPQQQEWEAAAVHSGVAQEPLLPARCQRP